MEYKYAIIQNGKVVGISRLSGPVNREDHIHITDEVNLVGKLWDGKGFVDGPPEEPPPEPSPSKTVEDVLAKLAELETKLTAIDTKVTVTDTEKTPQEERNGREA